MPVVNSMKRSFVEGYGELISKFQALPSPPRVFIMKPPPIDPNHAHESVKDFNASIINSVIQGLVPQVALKHHVTMLDAFQPLGGSHFDRPEYFTEDGVHLSSMGDCAVAGVIFSTLMSGKQLQCE